MAWYLGQREAVCMASDQVAQADELDRRLTLGNDLLASAGEVSRRSTTLSSSAT
jgi:hypothetical protein